MNKTKQKPLKPSGWQPLFDALQAFEPDFHIERDQPTITVPGKKRVVPASAERHMRFAYVTYDS